MKKVIFLSVLMLSGCMGNQKFDCPYNDGVRCLSVSEVDKQVSSGQIATTDKEVKKKKKFKLFSFLDKTELAPVPDPVQLSHSSALRTQEEVVQIWIAAYEGEEGIYHQPTVLNTVLKPAQWVGTVSEINGT
jgi:type IV conjugative transfer system lipoprotein TraV